MTRRLRQLPTRTLADPEAESVRREHHEAIGELQQVVTSGIGRVLEGIALHDGIITPIPHGLGRLPRMVLVSPPRGATSTGRIEEVRNSALDRKGVVALKASGWGSTITVDVEVK